ncbi:hypothetical protein AB0E96_40620, partial [Kitasatospora sp. NPDC036755]
RAGVPHPAPRTPADLGVLPGLGAGGSLAATGADTPVGPLLATAAGLLLVGGSATVLVRNRRGAARA